MFISLQGDDQGHEGSYSFLPGNVNILVTFPVLIISGQNLDIPANHKISQTVNIKICFAALSSFTL